MYKKKYSAILGLMPSKGARSPKLWNKVYRKLSLDHRMIAIDIKKKEFKNKINSLIKDKNFLGGAVTIPYKEKVLKSLEKSFDKRVRQIGAINCLYRSKKGKLFGANTDGEASLKVFISTVGTKKIKNLKSFAILGYGGVGKAVVSYFCHHFKKSKFMVFVRRKGIKSFKNVKFYNWSQIDQKLENIDVLINCTSIGFKEHKSPIETSQFSLLKKCKIIFDVIYQPKNTKLLSLAKKNKIFTLNGLDMNLEQAVLAFKKTNKVKISLEKIRAIMKK